MSVIVKFCTHMAALIGRTTRPVQVDWCVHIWLPHSQQILALRISN